MLLIKKIIILIGGAAIAVALPNEYNTIRAGEIDVSTATGSDNQPINIIYAKKANEDALNKRYDFNNKDILSTVLPNASNQGLLNQDISSQSFGAGNLNLANFGQNPYSQALAQYNLAQLSNTGPVTFGQDGTGNLGQNFDFNLASLGQGLLTQPAFNQQQGLYSPNALKKAYNKQGSFSRPYGGHRYGGAGNRGDDVDDSLFDIDTLLFRRR